MLFHDKNVYRNEHQICTYTYNASLVRTLYDGEERTEDNTVHCKQQQEFFINEL